MKKIKLSKFREDPDNVSEATDEEIARLAAKLKRVPLGLTAMRIAYVTDAPGDSWMVVSGNKRLRCLKAAYGEDGEVPAEWFQDITAMSEAERHEFRLNANISDGHFNLDKLLAQYETAELSAAGLDDLLAELPTADEAKAGQTDEDAVPDAPETPVSRRGEVYQCGEHRLMCGDSTSADDVARLMGGEKAQCLLTDPPYNVAIVGCTADELTIENDNMDDASFQDFLNKTFKCADDALAPGAVCYVWHASRTQRAFENALNSVGLSVREQLIWVKNNFTLGRQDYQWRHEPCFYLWKEGSGHKWKSDRTQSTVLEFPKPSRSEAHPTMKPVELIKYQMGNSTEPGDLVLDLFGGSGTTLIAAEQTNRKCRMMELDTHYCDVIRKRWAEFVHGEGCDWQTLTPRIETEVTHD